MTETKYTPRLKEEYEKTIKKNIEKSPDDGRQGIF